MSLRAAWATNGISGQAGLQSDIFSQKKKKKSNDPREDTAHG